MGLPVPDADHLPDSATPEALSARAGSTAAVGLAVAASVSGLTACGGGGGGGGGSDGSGGSSGGGSVAPLPEAPQQVARFEPMTDERAARLLNQAGLGATPDEVRALVEQGAEAWLDTQLAMPVGAPIWAWAQSRGFDNQDYAQSDFGLDQTLWRRLATAPDVLRQRVVLALSQIFVVSPLNMVAYWRQFGCLAWWELLEQHCFGNFRDLLTHVTLSPAMGVYLSMRGSAKADGSGRQPDENYARELLQLFTIGLTQLNLDGTPTSPPRETYTARDVSELAKVFTGWDVNGFNPANPTGPFGYWRAPMDFNPSRFDTSDKQVLGVTIPGSLSGPEALSRALDIIFAHPNVGPFIARQLIQRLVTSNPSPAYVSRVARVFNNNGASPAVRGDLKAVIRAVLADPEARPVIVEPAPGALNTWRDGKLREPIVRLLQWLRLARCSSVEWNVLDLSASDQLGQAPLRAPSVFNFYRPGYVPPHTVVAEQGLVAPEFQITHESSVVGYLNFLWGAFVTGGWGRVTLDYRDFLPLADDAPALVDRLNLHLTGRTLSATTVSTIVQGVQSILGTGATERLNRVLAAFYLIMVSPEYLVQR